MRKKSRPPPPSNKPTHVFQGKGGSSCVPQTFLLTTVPFTPHKRCLPRAESAQDCFFCDLYPINMR